MCHYKVCVTKVGCVQKRENKAGSFARLALCVLQMCSNVRWAVRDFALNILSLEGERNFVLGLRTTSRALCRLGISIPSADNRC